MGKTSLAFRFSNFVWKDVLFSNGKTCRVLEVPKTMGSGGIIQVTFD
jgi:hypothetical protein